MEDWKTGQYSAAGEQSQVQVKIAFNLAVAWTSLAIGAITGMILGLWSFGGPVPVPAWIGEYDDLPRRFLRLGHIAFFGLGFINIMLSRHFSGANAVRSGSQLALGLMNFGNIVLPPTLVASAFFEPFKYVMSLPASAITIALCITAFSAVQHARRRTQ